MAERKRSEKQLANDKVMEVFLREHPPTVPWNRTVWNRQLGILKKALLNSGYTHAEVCDALVYARMKGKHVKSLSFIPYIIEESKQYWAQIRQREAERLAMLEKSQEPVKLDTMRKPNAPGWLNLTDDIEEVE
jgi:hypothetical protein